VTHGGGHPPDLSVLPLCEGELKPRVRDARSVAYGWVTIRYARWTTESPHLGGAGLVSFNEHTRAELFEGLIAWLTFDLHPIAPLMSEAWVTEAVLSEAVVREQQEALAVSVKAARRVDVWDVDERA
jgi:hypothetical protein